MADQQRQMMLLSVLLIGGIGYATYNYVYVPRSAEVAELQTRLERLEAQNLTARQLTAREGRSQVERQLALYRDQLVQVEGLIPSSEELPDLLDAISAEAQRTGVDLALIQPVGASAEQFYTRRTYDLAVRGGYHEIGEFLTEIASLRRIITPINLSVTVMEAEPGQSAPQLEAKFAIETYVLPSEDFPAPPPADSTAAASGTTTG
jgi:type IV pilus assembly protein PilO